MRSDIFEIPGRLVRVTSMTFSKVYAPTGYVYESCWCSAEQGKACPRSYLRIWSRETGSAFPSPVRPLIILHAATSRERPRDRAHGRGDCHSDEGNGNRESSGAGRASRGTAEIQTSTSHPAGVPPTHHPHLARGESPTAVERRGHYRTSQEGRKTECGNYRGISLVSYAGKVLLKGVARRLSAYCQAKRLLPEEQCEFRPNRSTTDMMFVVRRLQEIGRKAGVSLFMCFTDLQKVYDTVDRTLLWQVLTRIGVPPADDSSHPTIPRWDESLCAT